LRKIQSHIEYFEPRFDPTVIAVADPSASKGNDTTPKSNGVTPTTKPSALYYSAADYRALYLKGELTPTAVAKAILPLIRKDLSPAGEHAIALFDTRVDLVIAAAKASTLRYKERRSLGPLDGIPTAIKDGECLSVLVFELPPLPFSCLLDAKSPQLGGGENTDTQIY
jgi:hypothetical protein